ncbi:MAG: hypothetical protein ACRCXH_15095 [Shewanella sp.]
MRNIALLGLSSVLALILTSCSSEPVKRYFPPQASLQQLQRLDNGQWQAQIRMQSYSSGAVAYQNLSLKVQLQDLEWLTIAPSSPIEIGANNAEIIKIDLFIPMNIQKTLSERLALNQSIRYVLNGQVESIDPKRTYTLDYQGRLNPAPGLNGVFR